MSEQVEITNNDWATEKTLEDLVNVITKKSNLSRQAQKDLIKALSTASSSTGGFKKSMESASKAIRNDTREAKALGDAFKEDTKVIKKHSAILDHASSAIKLGAASMIGAFAVSAGKLLNMSVDLERGGLGAMLTTQVAGVSTSLQGIAHASTTAGMSLTQFSNILTEYGGAVGTYGITQFSSGSKAIYSGLKQFGMTAREAGEYFGSYLERQRQMGVLSDLDQRKTQYAAMLSYKQTIQMANAMKMSREEIEANQKTGGENIDARFLLAQIKSFDQELGDKMQLQYDAIAASSPELAAKLIEGTSAVIFKGSALAADGIANVFAAGAPEMGEFFVNQSAAMAAGNLSIEDFLAGAKQLSSNGDMLQRIGIINDEATKNLYMTLQQVADTFDVAAFKKEADGTVTSMMEIKTSWDGIVGKFQSVTAEVLSDPNLMASISSLMGSLNEIIGEFLPIMQKAIPAFIADFTKTIHDFANEFREALNDPDFNLGSFLSDSLWKVAKDSLLSPLGLTLAAIFAPKGLLFKALWSSVKGVGKGAGWLGKALLGQGGKSVAARGLGAVAGAAGSAIAAPATIGTMIGLSPVGKYINEDMPKWFGGKDSMPYSTQLLDMFMDDGSTATKSYNPPSTINATPSTAGPNSGASVTPPSRPAESESEKRFKESITKSDEVISKLAEGSDDAAVVYAIGDLAKSIHESNRLLRNVANNTDGIGNIYGHQ